MTIVLVGGGSGGHITPLLAVAHELKKLDPSNNIIYIIEKGSRFIGMPEDAADVDSVKAIRAGKFRRYHGQSWFVRLLDVPTILKNIRDLFFAIVGYFQSVIFIRKSKPSVVLIKGGFVGVPVGLACRLLKVPYITHDSDTVPGLANRILSTKAKYHAVGMPEEFYSYPKSTTRYVGIPLSDKYQVVTKSIQESYRKILGIPNHALVLTIIGGSLGAKRLNESVYRVAPRLLGQHSDLYIFHQTGQTKTELYGDIDDKFKARIKQIEFTKDLYLYTGVANVVVTRAGATSIAELALQRKASVVIPNPMLTGGQQLKNAKYLSGRGASIVITEEQMHDNEYLSEVLKRTLADKPKCRELSENIGKLAKPHAAKTIAELLVKTGKDK